MTHDMLAKNPKRGIALLVTMIFMSVMLAFGLTLASLGYKQSVLASTAAQSQYAFYAADAALECALYADQKQQAFLYDTHDATHEPDPAIIAENCGGTYVADAPVNDYEYTASQLIFSERISFDGNTRCADVTVYKTSDDRTYLYAEGYNVSCATVSANTSRVVVRGLDVKY